MGICIGLNLCVSHVNLLHYFVCQIERKCTSTFVKHSLSTIPRHLVFDYIHVTALSSSISEDKESWYVDANWYEVRLRLLK
jgi:hypothetical protein